MMQIYLSEGRKRAMLKVGFSTCSRSVAAREKTGSCAGIFFLSFK